MLGLLALRPWTTYELAKQVQRNREAFTVMTDQMPVFGTQAARFNDDGTGDWLELSPRNPVLASWTIDKVLVHTRLAADLAGATKVSGKPPAETVAAQPLKSPATCTLL